MKIILVKSDCLDDWFTIERAEHEHRQWFESTGPNSMQFMDSARISDACVEGTAVEMLAIAKAIEARGSVSFKRCEVRVVGDNAFFCSPRNSEEDAEVSLADADAFAAQVFSVLGGSATSGETR